MNSRKLELKNKSSRLVHEKGLEKNVIITSFLEDALKKVRELDKEIETGLIYAKHSNPVKAALGLESKLSSCSLQVYSYG